MQRVLIVDDDKSLRSALSIMLGNAGTPPLRQKTVSKL